MPLRKDLASLGYSVSRIIAANSREHPKYLASRNLAAILTGIKRPRPDVSAERPQARHLDSPLQQASASVRRPNLE